MGDYDDWVTYWEFDFNGHKVHNHKYWTTEQAAYECLSQVLSDITYLGLRGNLSDFGAKPNYDI